MTDNKVGNNYCAKRQWRAIAILMVAIAVFPASTLAGNPANQILVKRSALYAASGSSKPHPQLSKLMDDGEHSNGWQLWEIPEGADPTEVTRQLNELYGDSAGSIAELNQPRLPQILTSESPTLTTLSSPNLAALEQLNLASAWQSTVGNAAVVVAVIDDGIDWQHPGLHEKIWRNEGEVANDGVDNDSNGFVDDSYGWNFRDNNNNPGHQSGDRGHGTLVAGAIAGDFIDDTEVRIAIGSAPGVRLMPLRISHDSHSLLRALTYAANNHADIINISLGGILPSIAEEEAIANLRDRGILVVAAAGNHHNNNDFRGIYPASYKLANVLSVAARNTAGALTGWSQYGSSSVDIAAPAVDLFTTERGGGYVVTSGTSMATGYTSGVAALIKSQFPGENYRAIKARLFAFATPIDPPFVTRSDSAINATAALTNSPRSTFVIRQLSSSIVGNQRDILIEVEPYFTGVMPPRLVDSSLHCRNYADNNSVAIQAISQTNYLLTYRVAATTNSNAADLRCQLSLTDDQTITTERRFRITEPRQLTLNKAVQATLQTSAQDDYQHWVVNIPAGSSSLELFVRSEQNVDVLLRPEEAPRYVASLGTVGPGAAFLLTDTETSRSASSSGFERLRRNNPKPGKWHIVVLNQQQQRNTRYNIEVTSHFSGNTERVPAEANDRTETDVMSRRDSGGGAISWLGLGLFLTLSLKLLANNSNKTR